MTNNPDRLSSIRFRREVQHHLAWSLHSFLLQRLARRRHNQQDHRYWTQELRWSLTCGLPQLVQRAERYDGFDPEPILNQTISQIQDAARAHVAEAVATWEQWHQLTVEPGPVLRDYLIFWRYARTKFGETQVGQYASMFTDHVGSPLRTAAVLSLAMGTDRTSYCNALISHFFEIEVHYRCVFLMRQSSVQATTTTAWEHELEERLVALAQDMVSKFKKVPNRLKVFKEAVVENREATDRFGKEQNQLPQKHAIEKVRPLLGRRYSINFPSEFSDKFDRALLEFAKKIYVGGNKEASWAAAKELAAGIGR